MRGEGNLYDTMYFWMYKMRSETGEVGVGWVGFVKVCLMHLG